MFCIKICFFGAGRSRIFLPGAGAEKNIWSQLEPRKNGLAPQQ